MFRTNRSNVVAGLCAAVAAVIVVVGSLVLASWQDYKGYLKLETTRPSATCVTHPGASDRC